MEDITNEDIKRQTGTEVIETLGQKCGPIPATLYHMSTQKCGES